MATSSISGSGIQPYTPARVDYLASYLQGLLPGLSHDAAVRWIRAEQGVNGNVLGVTYHDATGTQRLRTYSSQEAGLSAAAGLVRSSSNYAGIRAVLAGGDVTTQLKAIATSAWNAPGHYKFGASLGVFIPKPGSGTSNGSEPGAIAVKATATPEQLAAWQKALASIGLPTDPGHQITQAESDLIATKLYNVDPRLFGSKLVGKTVAELAVGGMIGFDPTQIPGAIKDFIDEKTAILRALLDVENLAYFLALIVGVPLALIGFYLLAGVPTGGQNA